MPLDALGRSFQFDSPPRRVVSLVPSLTETLFDLGAGDSVVGITDFCIFPEGLTVPRVGGTKNPRVEDIRALAPDIVYMNLEENFEKHARAIEEFAPVFVSEPKSVADVAALIGTLGEIHRAQRRANESRAQLDSELASIAPRDFSFVCAIWKKPWMWCGTDTYVSDLVAHAGGRNLIQEKRYPSVSLDDIVRLRPDVIFLPDEPYAFRLADAEEVRRISGSRVIGPFPGHLFTWHGTRTILGLRFLKEAAAS